MKPIPPKTTLSVWILARLEPINYTNTGSSPYMVGSDSLTYMNLESAQQAQTYYALKDSKLYHVFELEFPL